MKFIDKPMNNTFVVNDAPGKPVEFVEYLKEKLTAEQKDTLLTKLLYNLSDHEVLALGEDPLDYVDIQWGEFYIDALEDKRYEDDIRKAWKGEEDHAREGYPLSGVLLQLYALTKDRWPPYNADITFSHICPNKLIGNIKKTDISDAEFIQECLLKLPEEIEAGDWDHTLKIDKVDIETGDFVILLGSLKREGEEWVWDDEYIPKPSDMTGWKIYVPNY